MFGVPTEDEHRTPEHVEAARIVAAHAAGPYAEDEEYYAALSYCDALGDMALFFTECEQPFDAIVEAMLAAHVHAGWRRGSYRPVCEADPGGVA